MQCLINVKNKNATPLAQFQNLIEQIVETEANSISLTHNSLGGSHKTGLTVIWNPFIVSKKNPIRIIRTHKTFIYKSNIS
jgi:hypothetical protein